MEASLSEKQARRLSNLDQRCKNRCGFYGNPIYLGYCSKCYKELVRDASVREDPGKLQESVGGALEASTSEKLGFPRFNMKKKMQSVAKGHGRIFKGGSPLRAAEAPGETSKKGRRQSAAARLGGDPFNEFLKTLKKPAAQDIVTHLKTFRRQVTEKSTTTVEEHSEAVLDFYTSMGERLTTHPLFRNMTPDQQDDMMDGIEKHLLTNIYQLVYSPATCDDEMKDLLFQRRVRMLHWLEPTHLDIPLNLQLPEVQELISKGSQELLAVDSKKAPRDKLLCIHKSCQSVLTALRVSRNGPASADEFVPSLIFMVIYTSPQHIHSNINYISRFSNPSRLLTGEAGYYFTNLCGAVSFIENATAENLKMTEEDFNQKMGYVDGKTDADLLIAEDDGVEDRERVLVLQSCCQGVKEITEHLQIVLVEAQELEAEMKEFKSVLKEQIDSILALPPSINGEVAPSSLDNLPPPSSSSSSLLSHAGHVTSTAQESADTGPPRPDN